MGLGLQGAYGAGAVQAGLRQRLIDQAMAEKQQQDMELARRSADRQDRQLDQNDQYRQDTLNEQVAQHAAAAADRYDKGTLAIDEATPPGFMPASTPAPLVGRLQMIGAITPQAARPRVDEGPLLPGDTGADVPEGFQKRATAAQSNTAADNARLDVTQQNLAADRAEGHRIQEEGNAQRASDAAAMRGVVGANAAGAAETRALTNEMRQTQIDAANEKAAATEKERTRVEGNARESTRTALDLVDRLEKHPGLSTATGLTGPFVSKFSQAATDANALRDQLVATLTLPNLGALKGPMSDKDVLFVKQLATRLGSPSLSEQETRRALGEAKTFLRNKSDAGGGAGNTIRARDPQGNLHEAPAGTALPAGWKAER